MILLFGVLEAPPKSIATVWKFLDAFFGMSLHPPHCPHPIDNSSVKPPLHNKISAGNWCFDCGKSFIWHTNSLLHRRWYASHKCMTPQSPNNAAWANTVYYMYYVIMYCGAFLQCAFSDVWRLSLLTTGIQCDSPMFSQKPIHITPSPSFPCFSDETEIFHQRL